MSGSSLAEFIEALKTDEALREQVVAAEQAASSAITRDVEAVTAVAADAGFYIDGWTRRPDNTKPIPTDYELEVTSVSCCWFVTSTI
jgi:hypothetical protein